MSRLAPAPHHISKSSVSESGQPTTTTTTVPSQVKSSTVQYVSLEIRYFAAALWFPLRFVVVICHLTVTRQQAKALSVISLSQAVKNRAIKEYKSTSSTLVRAHVFWRCEKKNDPPIPQWNINKIRSLRPTLCRHKPWEKKKNSIFFWSFVWDYSMGKYKNKIGGN